MKAQLQRAHEFGERPAAELVWLWTEADPAQAEPGGWYLVLENSALAIRVLLSPRAEPAADARQLVEAAC